MASQVLVCVPVDAAQARQVAGGQTIEGPLQGFTAGPELFETFGLEAADTEQAEYAALLLAGLWGLVHDGDRLVLTAMVDPGTLGPGDETANGGVQLSELKASSVEAWFSDEQAAQVDAVRAAVSGLSLDEAWDLAQVQALHTDHDLAWHSVTELPKACADAKDS